ncbi:MAG: AMP-binding protein [Kiritimatiellae bacterium]|nr:AMP-binding protein [Kiritimatiellia bacterium]
MDEVIFTTSGSSGAAKTVVRTERSLRADAAAIVASFPEVWRERPAVVATVPADHMFGALWRVRAPECAGCEVEPETVISVEQLAAVCEKRGRVLFVTTPSFLEKALTHPDAAALRGAFAAVVTSGSLLRGETAIAAAGAFGVCPLEIFGSTETGTVAWRRRTEGELWTLLPPVAASADAGGRVAVESPFAVSPRYVMSDAVVFEGARRFRLLGRTDRRVKILEEFVSLPDVEKAFESHPYIRRCRTEECGGPVPRLGALMVFTAEGCAALAAGTYAEVCGRLRRDLTPSLGGGAFPRKLRFVHAMPVDARGKTTAAAVRAALSEWCREPAVTGWLASSSELEARMTFPPDCECFRGHFPGFPVLPGVAQLYFLRRFAREAFADFPEAPVYRRLKFQKLVLPGVEVHLSVAKTGEGRFEFELKTPSGRCASGAVEGAAAT